MPDTVVLTRRLRLRAWKDTDRVAFAEMNADPAVMEFFPSVLTRAESDVLIDRFESERVQLGFCPWAVELRESGDFIGFVGLHRVPDYLPFAPGVEVGWRLAQLYWGQGYATEAGIASLEFGFEKLGLWEVVSFTALINERSRRVMARLAMRHDPTDDFEHPEIDEGHALRTHVLYRRHAD